MNTASIFDIQKFSLHDGPGIRTTVFFKGCNLRCQWCHNPEGLELSVQESCDGRQSFGRTINAAALLAEVETDVEFYKTSDGGVTCSGGECMLQADFLKEFILNCQQKDVHVAIDTAGNVPFSEFEKVLPFTDLFLYDIKLISPQKHHDYTGVDNHLILENLAKLFKTKKTIWIRIPLIPEVNADAEELGRIADFLQHHGFAGRIDIMGYHSYGRNKYRNLYGTEQKKFLTPDVSIYSMVQDVFKEHRGILNIAI